MKSYINFKNLKNSSKNFKKLKPFPVIVIDNFFKKKYALNLLKEFPDISNSNMFIYNNPVEIKKACNNWNMFPKTTYEIFSYLNSNEFLKKLSKITKIKKLFTDIGLNGGGWHIMGRNGKLNPHLDYSLHPKLNLKRKLNLIVFLSKVWRSNWGGETQFFKHDKKLNSPQEIYKSVIPKFNRAILFDTSINSWHGVKKIICPQKICRKTLAVYYLTHPSKNTSKRKKALYKPANNQKVTKKLLEFIKKRSNSKLASKVYIYKS